LDLLLISEPLLMP